MDRDTRIGGAGTAGNETDARHACRFGIALRHETSTAFLAIGNQANFRRAVESVQNSDIAFTRYAEYMPYTLVAKTLSHCMTGNHKLSSGFVEKYLLSYNARSLSLSTFDNDR